jgi:hypothetical protein
MTGGDTHVDNQSQPLTVELITNASRTWLEEIGAMDPENPSWGTVLAELSLISQ